MPTFRKAGQKNRGINTRSRISRNTDKVWVKKSTTKTTWKDILNKYTIYRPQKDTGFIKVLLFYC
jgi:hypothetical protein